MVSQSFLAGLFLSPVYLFDEKWYPSGVAGNTIQKLDPAFQRLSIRLQYIRYRGPLAQVSIMPPWTQAPGSMILGAYAYPYEQEQIDYARGLPLPLHRPDSPHMHGILHGIKWDVPPGDWLVCFVIQDRSDNYIDPLHPGAVEAFRDRVYESSKIEVGHYFGHTIKGFFFDEPLYYNKEQEVPWGYRLRERFIEAKGYDPLVYLPALWLSGKNAAAATFVYDYYEVLNSEYARTYCRPLYEWCAANGLKYVGHWYEHEAAPAHGERYMFHNRTTEGPGDFFRVSRYAHEGGVDVVCNQIIPGHRNRDYWGLPKLGSSAAHIYGLEQDLALSETFGAYGWHLGLRMMKWLTDWQAVKGINHFILHAFNPKWPDLDCPPYFSDGGLNPQWPYFSNYVTYVNRLQDAFRGGRHVASLLLLYPGSVAYSGNTVPIEDVQQILCEHQYDYDLIPQEVLVADVTASDGQLRLQQETYQGIVIPGLEYIPAPLLQKLMEIRDAGIPVFFSDRYPNAVLDAVDGVSEQWTDRLTAFCQLPHVHVTEYTADLPQAWMEAGIQRQVTLDGTGAGGLRLLHRIKDEESIWLLSNECVDEAAEGWFALAGAGDAEAFVAWEPLTGDKWRPDLRKTDTGTEFYLCLPPYRSLILTADHDPGSEMPGFAVPAPYRSAAAVVRRLPISAEHVRFDWKEGTRSGFESWLELDPAFSGTVVYTWELELGEERIPDGERLLLDLGRVEEIAEVAVNGVRIGHSFVPPYRFDVTAAMRPGMNAFTVAVTNVVSNRMSAEEAFGDSGANWRKLRQQFAIPKEGGLLGPVVLEQVQQQSRPSS
ncbi:glycosylhydrolase-like jelly roll fold domain-containing protein [Cohnella hongkongensis]|uniref:Glycosylhydrolase-like jelly roll fold domain-containing protein n=1 Tax=Cohnella hongkongensis TaxID=178337 RepID=A0ABV9F771_9BACL